MSRGSATPDGSCDHATPRAINHISARDNRIEPDARWQAHHPRASPRRCPTPEHAARGKSAELDARHQLRARTKPTVHRGHTPLVDRRGRPGVPRAAASHGSLSLARVAYRDRSTGASVPAPANRHPQRPWPRRASRPSCVQSRQGRRGTQRARQVTRLKDLHRFLTFLHDRPPPVARHRQHATEYRRQRTEPWGETVATHREKRRPPAGRFSGRPRGASHGHRHSSSARACESPEPMS
jgi:hypothetical protein